jgi:leucyl-tRNA synthetase
MFMGPLADAKSWSTSSVEGPYRFLGKVWRVFIDDRAEAITLARAVQDVPPEAATLRLLHQTIQRVTEDLDGMRFNTAIAAMMEYINHLTSLKVRPRSVLEPFVLLLSPFAPHIAEELWQALGHTQTLAYEPWPQYDPALTKEETIEIPVQVNGKVRVRLDVPEGLGEAELERRALADERVKEQIAGKQVRKVIAKPGRMVSIVVG